MHQEKRTLLEEPYRNLSRLELLIQAAQVTSSNTQGIENASFWRLYSSLKKWKCLFQPKSPTFSSLSLLFLHFLGLNEIIKLKKAISIHFKWVKKTRKCKNTIIKQKKLIHLLQKENQRPHKQYQSKKNHVINNCPKCTTKSRTVFNMNP